MITQEQCSNPIRIIAGMFVAGLVTVLLVFASAPIPKSVLLADVYLSPEVKTNEATEITSDSATLNGSLTSLGQDEYVAVYFDWGTSDMYGNETTMQVMTSLGTFSLSLEKLTPNTTYHFRANASGINISYGKGMTVTTQSEVISSSVW